MAGNSDYGFRVYRTFAGLRYLCTSHVADPESDHTKNLMTILAADRSYRALCRVQKCFRARTATGTEVVVSQSDNPRTGATLRVVDTPEGPAIEASTGDEARQRGDGAPDRACPKDDEGGCPLGD